MDIVKALTIIERKSSIPLENESFDTAQTFSQGTRDSITFYTFKRLEDWADKKEILPQITYLKTDAAEAEILTGTTDREKAAKIVWELGAREILITHNTEVLVYDGKKVYTCPIRARNLSGRTGRGDTTFAAYINERLQNDIKTSLLYATATVSLKMETPGPFKGSIADVEKYINEFYGDIK